jgi:predicted TIM-barrel fold metal-dependent hydrolase
VTREPIVDLHTHFFGPVFFRTLAAAAHPRGDVVPGFGRLRAAGIEVPQGSPVEHARRWLGEMDRHGIDRMVTFASVPEEMDSVAEAVGASGGRLVPFCLVNPAAEASEERARTLVEGAGARGLLLFPAMHHFDLSDPELDGFYRQTERWGIPLIVHMGALRVQVRDLLGLPSDFDIRYANPARLDGAAERFPGIRFVIPHFGGGYFEDALALARRRSNVSVDTSSSNAWIRLQPGGLTLAEVFRRTVETLGADRVHFGTDSSVFPRGWRSDVYREQVRAMEEAGLSAADRARILAGNTLDLLG